MSSWCCLLAAVPLAFGVAMAAHMLPRPLPPLPAAMVRYCQCSPRRHIRHGARAATTNAPAAPWRCPNAPSTWNSGLPMPALLSHTSLCRPGPHTTQLRRRTPGQAMPRQDCVVYARSAGDTPPMLHCHCVCPMLCALARLTLWSAKACDVEAASLQRVRTRVPCSVLRTWRLMTESWCTSA